MINLDHALHTATDAACAAGKLIRKAFDEPIRFESKGDPADRLTRVDTDAQTMIRERLTEGFPEAGFLGEEETPNAAPEVARGHCRWIVDPLDGTMNFTHHLPFCGTSIGLEVDDEMVIGVLYFPMLDWMYTAVKGNGSFKNKTRIRVTDCGKLADALIAEIFSDREMRGKQASYPNCTAYRKFGSAITSAAFVAEGAVDGTILRCRKWDIAAAEVIIAEAGGSTTTRMDDPEDPRSSLTFVGSNPTIHEDACTLASKIAGSSVRPG